MIQAPWRRAGSIALAASIAAGVAQLAGCKQASERADQAVAAQLATAENVVAQPNENPGDAIGPFKQATTVQGASSPAKIHAELTLVDANLRAADALIADNEARQAEIARLTGEIAAKAASMQLNNVMIAGFRALEPKATEDALTQQVTAAQGGSDGAPWVAGDAPVPSQTGVKQQIAALKDQIEKLTTQKNDQETQRAQLAQQAEQLRAQSEAAKGKESVDLFTQAAALTKKAADLAIQNNAIDAQVTAAQQDLAVAQAAQTQLDASVQDLNTQAQQARQGWSDVEKLIQQYADQNSALLTPASGDAAAAPTTPPAKDTSITALAAQIDKLKTANTDDRNAAEQYLLDAANAAKTADTTALQFSRTYRTLLTDPKLQNFAQHDAWQGIIDLENASDFQLREALIQLRLARLYSDWAMTTATRAMAAKIVGTAVAAASLTPPDSLKAGALNDEVGAAKKKADAAYAAADDMLSNALSSAAAGPLARDARDAAQALQIFATYAHSRFLAAMGDNTNAAAMLAQSKRLRDAATDANLAMPPLPQGLQAQAVAVGAATTPAAATTPTPAPSAPAAPAAPAPSGSSVFGNPGGAPTTPTPPPGGVAPPTPQ